MTAIPSPPPASAPVAPPVSGDAGRRRIVREFFALSAARYLSAGLGVARGVLIPGLLNPGLYGVYKTYQMVSELSRIGTFGILSALFRELPIAVARGDERRRVSLLANAFWSTMVSLVPVVLGVAVGVRFDWIRFEDVTLTGWFLLLAPLLLMDRLRIFFDVVFNGQKQFMLQAKLRALDEGLATVAYVGGTWALGFPGLLLASLGVNTLLVALYWRGSGFRVTAGVDRGLAREMVGVGFPHMLNGLGNTIYTQLDRMVILGALGLVPLGFYSVGMTLTNQLVAASQIVGRVLTPRMMERFSEREQVQDLRQVFVPPARMAALGYAPAVLLCAVLAEPLFVLVLPAYRDGLLPFQVVILGGFFAAIWATVHPFFLAIKQQWKLLWVYCGTIPVALVLNLIAVRLGLGLPGIALATALTQFGFVTTVLMLALSHLQTTRHGRMLEVLRIYAPLAPAVAAWWIALWLRGRMGLADEPLWGALAQAGLLLALYGAAFGAAAAGLGWAGLIGTEPEDE